MKLVQTVAVQEDSEVAWVDNTVQGLVTYSYRLVAVDDQGNISEPSSSLTARAFDEKLPVSPQLTVKWVNVDGMTHAQVDWISTEETLLQRRLENSGFWSNLRNWRPSGVHTVLDTTNTNTTQTYQYRLRVRSSTGSTSIGEAVTLAFHD